jgi:hypothetical protein
MGFGVAAFDEGCGVGGGCDFCFWEGDVQADVPI